MIKELDDLETTKKSDDTETNDPPSPRNIQKDRIVPKKKKKKRRKCRLFSKRGNTNLPLPG